MLHVLNTRPAERADPLTQTLQQAGYVVTALPLLELVAEPFAAIQLQLSDIWQVAIVVVVSPAAAQLGLAGLTQLDIVPRQLKCQWVAVGRGTAAVLAQAGITAHIPALETSEGMLALDVFQHNTLLAANPAVMFWRGFGGREFMLKQLASVQQVISVNLYRRQLPESSKVQYQQLLSRPPQVLLISSGVSWQHWLQLGQQFGWILPSYILVLGQRVYQNVRQQLALMLSGQVVRCSHEPQSAPPQVILLDNLHPATLLSVLASLQKCQQT